MGSSHSHVENNTTIQQNIIQTTAVAVTTVLGDVNAGRRKFIKAYQFAAFFHQYLVEHLLQGEVDEERRLSCIKVVMRGAIAQCAEHGVSRAYMRDVYDKMNAHFGWELSAGLFDEVIKQMYDVRDPKDRIDSNESNIAGLTRCFLAYLQKLGISEEEEFVRDLRQLHAKQAEATIKTQAADDEMKKLYDAYESNKQNLEERITRAITEMEEQQQKPQIQSEATVTEQTDQPPEQAQAQSAEQAKQQAEQAAATAAEEESKKKAAEEEEEANKKAAEEEQAKQQQAAAEEEAKKKAAEEEQAKQQQAAAAEEAKKKAAEEEQAKQQQAAAEEEAKKKAAEEEAKKKAAEEEQAKQQQAAAEEEAKKKAAEEEAKKKAAEEEAKKKAAEEQAKQAAASAP